MHLIFSLGWRCSAHCPACIVTADVRISRANPGAAVVDGLPVYGFDCVPRVDLTPETLSAVLARYPEATGVTFSSFGEPLEHPRFRDLWEIAAARGSVSLVTNGSRLAEHLYVLDSPGCLSISVDSADLTTLQAMRPGIDAVALWRTVERVTAAPRHHGRTLSLIQVLTQRNRTHVEALAARCSELGIPLLTVGRGLRAEGELLGGDPEVARSIAAARSWVSVADHYTYHDGGQTVDRPERGGHCTLPSESLTIDPTGHAHACCRLYGLDLGDAVSGDPWRGEALARLRTQLADRSPDLPAPCQSCTFRYGSASGRHLGS